MSNPAEHEARKDADRRGVIVGTPEDAVEDWLIADTAGEDDGGTGAWVLGEGRPA